MERFRVKRYAVSPDESRIWDELLVVLDTQTGRTARRFISGGEPLADVTIQNLKQELLQE